ncbi:MAG: translation initiation factor IF-2 [Bdellovibrionota bacterium]
MDQTTEKVLTEKRVTKKVIRRRRTEVEVKDVASETELHASTDVESSVDMDQTQTVDAAVEAAPKVVATPIKRVIKKVQPSSVLKKVVKVVEKPAKEPVKETVAVATPKVEAPGDNYSRLKVVSQPQRDLQPKITSFPTEEEKRELANEQRRKASLSRKEIIDVRDVHRPRSAKKKKLSPGIKGKKTEITVPKAAKRVLKIREQISVQELAKKMSVKAGEVIRKLMGLGVIATINQTIDADTATLVASEFEFEVENVAFAPEDLLVEENLQTNLEHSETRPPVVTVMGHVDHGKTSLLDSIRKADVASGEAGGITQHIGAYTVKTGDGKYITFIDTPGHESFTAMRARGAQVTDIVVLVVAGDDGVMPQTKEAINHAKSANVPIIVAVNKMDKPGVDIDRIKKELTEFEMVPEEWGGDTIYVPVSAKTGKGVEQLLEFIHLQSDILELKADPKTLAKCVVIESRLDKGRGSVMSVLVQQGTLRLGDNIVSGGEYGRVRDMRDDRGAKVKDAGPSKAVEITGLSGIATAGDLVNVVKDERVAKQISQMRVNIAREKELAQSSRVSLDDLYNKIAEGDVKELRVVVKADTAGSVEVLKDTLEKLSTAKVTVKVIHGAVGGITENDVTLALASGAIIVGFNVRPQTNAKKLAEQKEVEIRLYKIIYELSEDIQTAMAGLLAPKEVENVLGHAEVRETYSIPRVGTVAGCQVVEGKILRSNQVRLIRDDVVVYTGKLASLKRFKDDAREITQGKECGLSIENFNDIKVGDVVESFEISQVAASLE